MSALDRLIRHAEWDTHVGAHEDSRAELAALRADNDALWSECERLRGLLGEIVTPPITAEESQARMTLRDRVLAALRPEVIE